MAPRVRLRIYVAARLILPIDDGRHQLDDAHEEDATKAFSVSFKEPNPTVRNAV
jgi:hypothetical protein